MIDKSLSQEQELLICLAKLHITPQDDERIKQLLSEPLDWNTFIVLAAKHKVLQLIWDNLLRLDLVQIAVRKGGLTKLWAHYISQLYAVNRERNRLYLTNIENLTKVFSDKGLRLILLKGGALIGDLYTHTNRMLHDIDLLGSRDDIQRIKDCFYELGYQYGVYNDAKGTIKPINRRLERFWIFQNHTLPSFYKLCDDPFCNVYKIQVGFNFFDNYEEFSFDSTAVLEQARLKDGTETVLIPSLEHMLINICCHIYREGVSIVYADSNDNWQLTKFCDLFSLLKVYGHQIDRQKLLQQINDAAIQKPYYFAMHHTYEVYQSPLIKDWMTLVEPGDTKFLNELRDGKKIETCQEPFYERLFSLRSVRHQPRGGWNQYFDLDQW